MAHNYQKKWVFTWNSDSSGELPKRESLIRLLNDIAEEGVFQLEKGKQTGRLHYQGRFKLLGGRLGKKRLLEIFSQVSEITNLTFDQEILYDSSQYCVKDETRVEGPWYVGTDSYRNKMAPMQLNLKKWQKELIREIKDLDDSDQRDRKVIWVQDTIGGAGKSTFAKYLSFGQKDIRTKKLPIDKPDRIRMAVCKIVQKENVDLFTFDFTRTMGEDTSMKDLFQVIEELKNGHIVSVMYGTPMEVVMTSPHVVIFTNERFEDYEGFLSKNRWQPYSIGREGGLNAMYYDNDLNQIVYTPVSKLKQKNIKAQPGKAEPTFTDLDDFKRNGLRSRKTQTMKILDRKI